MFKKKAFLFVLLACVMSLFGVFAACDFGSEGGDVAVTAVVLTQKEANMQVGDEITLTAIVTPSGATNKEVIWTSSNTGVATVEEGVVTAVAAGQATVTVTTVDGAKSAECTVIVSATPDNPPASVAVTGVTLDKATLTLQMGATTTATLTATVAPSNATNKNVTWSSSDNTVATVSNGVVTAVAAGTATITVTTEDGSKTATCVVTVEAAQVDPNPDNPPASVAVTGVALDKTTLALQMGATTTATLVATVAPSNATNKNVTWSSSDNTVATVSNGVVTAVAAGQATITVTTVDGSKTATCAVTVEAETTPDNPPASVAVTGVALDKTTETLQVGNTVTLTATVAPSNATNKNVTWSTSDNTVATVSNGVVTAVAAGQATITVTTEDGSKTATCAVTVEAAQVDPEPDNPPAANYTADGTYALDIENGADSTIFTTSSKSDDGGYNSGFFKLASNDYIYVTVKLPVNKEITITGTARPTNSARTVDLNIALSSDSTGKVSDIGKDITCNDTGVDINKVITVTTEGEIKLVFKRSTTKTGCEITSLSVTIGTAAPVAVEGVSLNKTESALKVGESETLTATVAPSNATDKTVTWASSNTEVATVVNGAVTALKAGTAIITVTTTDGNKTASCTYTVTNIAVESVSFATSGTKMAVGNTINLTVTVLPENATIKTVTYTSSNNAIATVDNNGKVTATGVGTATITVTADGGITATYSVEVLAEIVKVTGVSLNVTSGTLNTETEEKTVQLNPVIAPSNATNKNVTYSSNNALVASVDKNGLVTAHQKSGVAVITVTTEDGEKTAIYTLTVEGPALTANTPEITKASADELETAYVEWTVKASDIWFNAYYMADNGSTWIKLDAPLIRQYATYYRADMVGLKAGTYKMKIVPVVGGKEVADAASIANGITLKSHDRSGFAFEDGHVPGAYNADGTLKENAIVVYVTEKTKNTVTATLKNNKGVATEYTGLYNILYGLKSAKGVGEPVAIRLIGNITDLANLDDGDLVVDAVKQGLTIEGIGNDATINGWGIRIKNSTDVEVRNIGFMNCDSGEGDNLGLQQGNAFVWTHNCDMFYGEKGKDSDQAKGDGALDTKTSTNVTHSYNHFWDNGKCNLQGMKSEKEENYITYHHNWYDHSDSRHPRIRTCTVHIYNNYFDGNAKYGVGVTMGASAFVENNYFRSTSSLKPMLSSEQGTDAAGAGTFSSETGGIIKSFNNIYDVTGGGTLYLRTYQKYGQDSDCYEVTDRNETVPSSVTTVKGGTKYNNFDTSSTMYKYTAESPEQAKLSCQRYAGRIDGGDFKWTFNNSVDDASYSVDTALKAALVAYKDGIVKIGE